MANSAIVGIFSAGGDQMVTLADTAPVELDASLGNRFKGSSAVDRTLNIPTNAVDGKTIIVKWLNTGDQERTLTLETSGAGAFRFTQEVTELPPVASQKSIRFGCIYDADSQRWDVISLVRGI